MNYFHFKDKKYIEGTIVILKGNRPYSGTPILVEHYDIGENRFLWIENNTYIPNNEYCKCVIKEIVKPVYYEEPQQPQWVPSTPQKKSDVYKPGIGTGVLLLIVIMIGSLIFKEFILIWAFAIIYFIIWCNK